MPIQLPTAQKRSALSVRGTSAPDTYARANIRAPQRDTSGMQNLARGLGQAGETLERSATKQKAEQNSLDLNAAKSYFLKENLRIQREIEQNPDYTKYEEIYDKQSGEAFQNAMNLVSDPYTRQILSSDLRDQAIVVSDRISRLKYTKNVEARKALMNDSLSQTMKNLLNATDEDSRQFALSTGKSLLQSAVNEGLASPSEALNTADRFRKSYATARAAKLTPAEGVKLLAPESKYKIEGKNAAILGKIAWLESRGDPNAENPNSSAKGLFQFTDATAKDFDVDPKDAASSIDGADRLLEQNREALYKKLNRYPTGAELYLAHQQRAKATGELLTNPNEKAVDVLEKVYGNVETARKAVVNNGGNVEMTSADFVQMWKDKYEEAETIETISINGAPDSNNAWVKNIPHEDRVKMYNSFQKQLRSNALESIYSLIDNNPKKALDVLNRSVPGNGLLNDDIQGLKATTREAIRNERENKAFDRMAFEAMNNESAWTEYNDGTMDLAKLQNLEGQNKIDPDTANFMREKLTTEQTKEVEAKKKAVTTEEKAAAFVELTDMLNQLQVKTEDGETTGKGVLEDYVRFQKKMLQYRKEYKITDGDAETFMKKIAIPFMNRVRDTDKGRKGWFPSNPLSDGSKAVDAWLEVRGRANDNVTRKDMLTELVNRVDAYRPEGAAPDYSLFDEKDTVKREKAMKEIIEGVTWDQAKKENPNLRLFFESGMAERKVPNTVLNKTGQKKQVMADRSKLQTDHKIQRNYKIMKGANGKMYKVFDTGVYQEIKNE